jgi:hypothetical protein
VRYNQKRIAMKKLIILFAIAMALISCGSSKVAFTDDMKQSIDSRQFVVNVNNAYPTSGKMVILTSLYSFKVKNDSAFSYLPYYGRAYSLPYGGGKGLIFNEKIKKYTQKYTKKNSSEINATVANDEDTYRFFILLYPNGTASITMNCNNRQSISFTGNWDAAK